MLIKTKLILLAVVSVFSLMTVVIAGYIGLNATTSAMTGIIEDNFPSVKSLLSAGKAQSDIARAGLRVSTFETDYSANARQAIREAISEQEEAWKIADASIAAYLAVPILPEDEARLRPLQDKFKTAWDKWKQDVQAWETVIHQTANLPAGQAEAQKALFVQYEQAFRAQLPGYGVAEEALAALVADEEKRAVNDGQAAESRAHASITLLIIIGIFGLVILTTICFSVFRAIMIPLEHTRRTISAIAGERDFTRRVSIKSNDEIGLLVKDFNNLVEVLQGALREIQTSMVNVRAAVESLSTAAQQVATSSSNQSSSTSAMAASIEEMTVSITTVSNSADEAQSIARQAGEISDEGGSIIGNTVAEMGEIAQTVATASQVIQTLGDESKQISSVVQVIKEVADQTNLLALNAAIEAARAGEQGRGFAVVADEVRKLAERTAQSTADIGAMIGKIQTSAREAVDQMEQVVQQVESGQTLAQDAGARIQSIREEAGKVSNAVTEISNALKEQSQASQDIAKHVESIAQMTDENNAAAEETAAGAQHLDELAQEVNRTVNQFKV